MTPVLEPSPDPLDLAPLTRGTPTGLCHVTAQLRDSSADSPSLALREASCKGGLLHEGPGGEAGEAFFRPPVRARERAVGPIR